VNDIPPLQNAGAVGQGGEDDFSKWTFRYTDDYQLIAEAANELRNYVQQQERQHQLILKKKN
jgi:hypothetical protein